MTENNYAEEFKKGMQMACPKCTEPMHMAAQRCPNCKYDFSKDEVKTNIASKKSNPAGCLVITALAAVALFAGMALWPSSEKRETAESENFPKALNAGEEYAWKETAKEVVSKQLRDPDSAVFSDMKVYPETKDSATIICGYVNSRNGFGGMTGPQRFIAGGTVMLEEQFTKAQMTTAWMRLCN